MEDEMAKVDAVMEGDTRHAAKSVANLDIEHMKDSIEISTDGKTLPQILNRVLMHITCAYYLCQHHQITQSGIQVVEQLTT